MRITAKQGMRLGLGLALVLAAGAIVVRTWLVPRLLAGTIGAQFGTTATIDSWWLNGRSAGVTGLALHEGPGASSPAWARAGRVETDLTLGGLLRGRVTPRRVTLQGPELTLRLDRQNKFVGLPTPPKHEPGKSPPLPELTIASAVVTFRQEGRPEMVVHGIDATLRSRPEGAVLDGRADDPEWGRLTASGTIAPDLATGAVKLVGAQVRANSEKVRRLPFVPPEVWANVTPDGPVDVALALEWGRNPAHPVKTHLEIALRGTRATSSTLGLDAREAQGTIVVDDGLVRVERVKGKALGGGVDAHGTLDFTRNPPSVALDLGLHRINIAATPKAWQLDEAGITGRLTGQVKLRAALKPAGADLSGSSGDAVVEDGTVQGIPFKSLKLAMNAEGGDLQYATKAPGEASTGRTLRTIVGAIQAGCHALPLLAWTAAQSVAFQATAVAQPTEAPAEPGKEKKAGGIQLPKSISTHIEFQDVDIAELLGRVKWLFGAPFPIPITGKLALKADATIPLGTMRDIKRYAFHGDLLLTAASIDRVDFGRLAARIDLADGQLTLSNLRGRLVNRPDGGPDNPPPAIEVPIPTEGALPTGAFRATVRASLAPLGPLSVTFASNQLPLGELGAPFLPRPTPLAGLATLDFEAHGDLAKVADPNAWAVSGHAESLHITYKGAALDRVALHFALKDGVLDVPDFAANLLARPLAARLNVDLKPPRAFRGTLDVANWDLAAMLAIVPAAPQPAPVSGTITVRAGRARHPRTVRPDDRRLGAVRQAPRRPGAAGRRPLPVDDRGGHHRPLRRRGPPVRRLAVGRGPGADRRRQGDRGFGEVRGDRHGQDQRRPARRRPEAHRPGLGRDHLRGPRRAFLGRGDGAALGPRPDRAGGPGRARPRRPPGASGDAPLRRDGREPRRQDQVRRRVPALARLVEAPPPPVRSPGRCRLPRGSCGRSGSRWARRGRRSI